MPYSRRPLLTADEAAAELVAALTATASRLRRHTLATIGALLHERPTRRALTDLERRALDRYARTLRHIRRAGHGGLIADQVDGFVSALAHDREFCSSAA